MDAMADVLMQFAFDEFRDQMISAEVKQSVEPLLLGTRP
jgi:hypothetical protein